MCNLSVCKDEKRMKEWFNSYSVWIIKKLFLLDYSHNSGSVDVRHGQMAVFSRSAYQKGYWVLGLTWTLQAFGEPMNPRPDFKLSRIIAH